MKIITIILALGAFAGTTLAAKKLELKDLPAPVQKAAAENLKGGKITNSAKEKENGITQYEFDTTLDGKTRAFNVDSKGTLLVVEEEASIDSFPAAAKAAILKKVGDGKLGLVETFQKPGQELMYEAGWTTKGGKKMEILVKADGSVAKI